MEFDDATIKYNQIFCPHLIAAFANIEQNNTRFVQYTSAETALKIIRNQELWFRNAKVMNDHSEIAYGLWLLNKVFAGEQGARFRDAVDSISKEIMLEVDTKFTNWQRDWQLETYIACVSIHKDSEDMSGRLSMWRAYGNTAFVVNNTPILTVTDKLGVYGLPVQYMNESQLNERLSITIEEFLKKKSYLEGLGRTVLVEYVFRMLFNIAIATKHPGFSEEQEWRLYYRPNETRSPGMRRVTAVINGVPQNIWVLKLINEPEHGLHGASIPSLLNRLIIGPTEHPYVIAQAFQSALTEVGVASADQKVCVSDIPLRAG